MQESIPTQAHQDQVMNLIYQQDITILQLQQIITQYQQWQTQILHHPTYWGIPQQTNFWPWLAPQQPVEVPHPPPPGLA